jgi:DNA-binding MarR family transcriptional regulator
LLSFSLERVLPLSKIGERLQVHATSVTNVVDRLEAAGLVRREPNPFDVARHARGADRARPAKSPRTPPGS